MAQKPSIGRIVHYHQDDAIHPGPLAALVTGVSDHTTLHLRVFTSNGDFVKTLVPSAQEPTPGHWNWPPRAEA